MFGVVLILLVQIFVDEIRIKKAIVLSFHWTIGANALVTGAFGGSAHLNLVVPRNFLNLFK